MYTSGVQRGGSACAWRNTLLKLASAWSALGAYPHFRCGTIGLLTALRILRNRVPSSKSWQNGLCGVGFESWWALASRQPPPFDSGPHSPTPNALCAAPRNIAEHQIISIVTLTLLITQLDLSLLVISANSGTACFRSFSRHCRFLVSLSLRLSDGFHT